MEHLHSGQGAKPREDNPFRCVGIELTVDRSKELPHLSHFLRKNGVDLSNGLIGSEVQSRRDIRKLLVLDIREDVLQGFRDEALGGRLCKLSFLPDISHCRGAAPSRLRVCIGWTRTDAH